MALRRDMNIGPSLSVMALLGEIGGCCGELVLPLIIELSVSVQLLLVSLSLSHSP